MQPEYKYNAKVTRVIDGDTLEAIVDLGFNIYTRVTFRLTGIDTPEKNSKIPEERVRASAATAFAKSAVDSKDVLIHSVGKDKYGRWLGDVYISNDQPTLNEQLVSMGLAKAYFGEAKQ